MVDITEISAMVAAAGVLVGVAYYILDTRNQTKMRQTDLTLRLFQQFSGKEFVDSWWQVINREGRDYNEYIKKYGATELFQISTYFEGVGILLHRKLLDVNMAIEFFGEAVRLLWEKNKTVLKEMHVDKCFWFEYLYNEMKKKEQQLAKTS